MGEPNRPVLLVSRLRRGIRTARIGRAAKYELVVVVIVDEVSDPKLAQLTPLKTRYKPERYVINASDDKQHIVA